MLKFTVLSGLPILLLMTACAPALGSSTVPQDAKTGTPVNGDPFPGPDATSTPALGTVAILPIPLHVGYGIRGPWYDIYFTDPANPASVQSTGGVDGPLAEAIDAARLSVHVAVFSLTLGNVREALIRAHRRGVDVRMVTESDNLDGKDLQRLRDAGIPVLGDRRQGTMHNKFMVIDGMEIWTGSMNFTFSGTYADNNVLLRVKSPELAADYEAEFAEMFEDDKFGAESGRATPIPRVMIEGSLVEVLFSPDDRPESVLVDLLDAAQESVHFMAFSFTSNPLGDALVRADRAGVPVRGVMDGDQGSSNIGTELPAFLSAGLDVRLDGNPGQMHEKVLIIDREVVAVGSYNFSRNANETNDENIVIIHNDMIAAEFVREFERLYALAEP
jgi:phosphatidylserine/phosphatidylglycerophosphate/cardiolipin synthase-like enzyme